MNHPARPATPKGLVELVAQIVACYVRKHVVPMTDVSNLITIVCCALDSCSVVAMSAPLVDQLKPAISVRKSVRRDRITCLECGGDFKSMKRHLTMYHSISPDDYREKWKLPADYPMIAPLYSEARSKIARELGLGQKRRRATLKEP
ncbi:MucR family transcriptional regulator [Rhizobium tumorigenes]|uniref:MucR family transcriptional regulator n=1 Tax=Rhizobium tumorigenes TaxID=2041385 RepID=A0AAF1K7W8_9HYPH|nr:MucR family transcriptional regulator [Rhizobium tumorigenes]WFR97717.1 MucR family transcriptional regulator [Rhizobium tumorigenes]